MINISCVSFTSNTAPSLKPHYILLWVHRVLSNVNTSSHDGGTSDVHQLRHQDEWPKVLVSCCVPKDTGAVSFQSGWLASYQCWAKASMYWTIVIIIFSILSWTACKKAPLASQQNCKTETLRSLMISERSVIKILKKISEKGHPWGNPSDETREEERELLQQTWNLLPWYHKLVNSTNQSGINFLSIL